MGEWDGKKEKVQGLFQFQITMKARSGSRKVIETQNW